MKTKTDLKAGYANNKLETPTIAIERLLQAQMIGGRSESFDELPFFKTGHTVAAILE